MNNKVIKIRIKEALVAYRERKGKKMTQQVLASLIKHKSSVSNIQYLISQSGKGKVDMPSSILKQIADICGVSTDYLLGRVDDVNDSSYYNIITKSESIDDKIKELKKLSVDVIKTIRQLKRS